jgi:hypothetical protein
VVLLLAQCIRLYTSRVFNYVSKVVRTTQIVGNAFENFGIFETLISNISIFLCIHYTV